MAIFGEEDLPPGVRQSGGDYDDRYYYREGRVVIDNRDFDLEDVAGIRTDFGLEPLGETDQGDDPISPEDLQRLDELGFAVVALPQNSDASVPVVLDNLRGRTVDRGGDTVVPRVAPSCVFFGATHMTFGGEDPPKDASADLGFPRPEDPGPDDIRVAVLDTGIAAHPSFPEWVHVTPNGDLSGHGTFVAGIIVRHAPRVEIFGYEVMRVQTKGNDAYRYVDDLRLTLQLLAIADGRDDIDIVTLSMASPTHQNLGADIVDVGINHLRLRRPQTAIVAAAGNWHSNRPNHPAAQKGVIAVAATEADGTTAAFSSFGPWVDTRALGRHVSTYPVTSAIDTGWARWAGTSFAVPVVVAATAREMRQSATSASVAAQQLKVDAVNTAKPDVGVEIDLPVI